jgi:hypothetical protein
MSAIIADGMYKVVIFEMCQLRDSALKEVKKLFFSHPSQQIVHNSQYYYKSNAA